MISYQFIYEAITPPKSQILWKFPRKKFSSKINCRKWHRIQNNIITYWGWNVPKLKNSNFHRSTLDNVCTGGKYIFIICFNYHTTSNIHVLWYLSDCLLPRGKLERGPTNNQQASNHLGQPLKCVDGWGMGELDGWPASFPLWAVRSHLVTVAPVDPERGAAFPWLY